MTPGPADAGVAHAPAFPNGVTWAVPPGWTREAFALPPSWSPKLGVTGWEEVRAAPGFSLPEAPDFQTSAAALWLEGQPTLDRPALQSLLETHARDRCRASRAGSDPAGPAMKPEHVSERFKVDLARVSEPATAEGEGEPGGRFRGTLAGYDCFGTGKPLTLHLRVSIAECSDGQHRTVLVLASPKQDGDAVWHDLDQRLAGFHCR